MQLQCVSIQPKTTNRESLLLYLVLVFAHCSKQEREHDTKFRQRTHTHTYTPYIPSPIPIAPPRRTLRANVILIYYNIFSLVKMTSRICRERLRGDEKKKGNTRCGKISNNDLALRSSRSHSFYVRLLVSTRPSINTQEKCPPPQQHHKTTREQQR